MLYFNCTFNSVFKMRVRVRFVDIIYTDVVWLCSSQLGTQMKYSISLLSIYFLNQFVFDLLCFAASSGGIASKALEPLSSPCGLVVLAGIGDIVPKVFHFHDGPGNCVPPIDLSICI